LTKLFNSFILVLIFCEAPYKKTIIMKDKENKKKIAQERGARVKLARQLTGMTRTNMTKKYQLHAHALVYWETGKSLLGFDAAQSLSQIFNDLGINITAEWLLTGQGHDATTEKLLNPLIQGRIESYVDESKNIPNLAGTFVNQPTNNTFTLNNEISFFKKNIPDAEVVMIKDNALLPFYYPGDYVGGIYSSDKTFVSLIGKMCIILTDQGDLMTRKIFKYSGNSSFFIGATSPLEIEESLSIVQIANAAPITRHWKI